MIICDKSISIGSFYVDLQCAEDGTLHTISFMKAADKQFSVHLFLLKSLPAQIVEEECNNSLKIKTMCLVTLQLRELQPSNLHNRFVFAEIKN